MPKRTDIRDAIYDIVVAATGFSSSNVEKGRYAGNDIASADLPRAIVYFVEEQREVATMGSPRTFIVLSTFSVEIFSAKGLADNTDEALDTHIENIEAQITDRKLGDIVQDAYVTSIEYTLNEDGEARIGKAEVVIETRYTISKSD